ncbi:hypothetical protein RG963_08055 [Methanosarcina sp. Z-7115]|uniref:Uncharacterized protein n=1 Tax=Methanosarcina baikalica TaxID=3073890 RepID=A0ABU2D169_9EURY|nr:hypothetical protein [Methanosarcina sp. Z-7115]MDR7665724.1 hypothetical protein [Methanosarcina sp. Z-7115]
MKKWLDDPTFRAGVALCQARANSYHGDILGLRTLRPCRRCYSHGKHILAFVPYGSRDCSLLRQIQQLSLVQQGSQWYLSFVGLLASAAFHFALSMPLDIFHAVTTNVAFIALFYRADILWVVLIGAVISVIWGIKTI